MNIPKDDSDDCYHFYGDLKNIFGEEQIIPYSSHWSMLMSFQLKFNTIGNNDKTCRCMGIDSSNIATASAITDFYFGFHIGDSIDIETRNTFLATNIDKKDDFLIKENNDTNWNTILKTLDNEFIKAFLDGDVGVGNHDVNIDVDVPKHSSDNDVTNGEHSDKSNYATTDEQNNDDEFSLDFIEGNIFKHDIHIIFDESN